MSGVYLITGASGFVGTQLVNRLISLGYKIAVVGRRENWVQEMAAKRYENLMVFRGDLGDDTFVKEIWNQAGPFGGIFHYAAQIPADIKGLSSDYDMAHYIHCNVSTTATLLDAASRQDKVPFIYASTISVFGQVHRLPIGEDHPSCPVDLYGLTKLLGEECVRFASAADKIRGVTLRFPGMMGLGNEYGAVHFYTSLCLTGQPVSVYGDGKPQKDYVAVDDVVEASILAMQRASEFKYEVFNIGGCRPGVPPPPLVEIARIVCEAYGSGDVLTNSHKPAEPVNVYFDNVKANRLLGYLPHPLPDRIREYVAQRRARASGCH